MKLDPGMHIGKHLVSFRKSGVTTSRVRLGVFHTVRDMYSFLIEYFSSVVLVLHAIRCRAGQAG
jgi:hypothetical protein